jgi:hypothetical protein
MFPLHEGFVRSAEVASSYVQVSNGATRCQMTDRWPFYPNSSCQTMVHEVRQVDELKMRETVHRLIEMLVQGDYHGVEEATRGRRLTAEQLRQAVGE